MSLLTDNYSPAADVWWVFTISHLDLLEILCWRSWWCYLLHGTLLLFGHSAFLWLTTCCYGKDVFYKATNVHAFSVIYQSLKWKLQSLQNNSSKITLVISETTCSLQDFNNDRQVHLFLKHQSICMTLRWSKIHVGFSGHPVKYYCMCQSLGTIDMVTVHLV